MLRTMTTSYNLGKATAPGKIMEQTKKWSVCSPCNNVFFRTERQSRWQQIDNIKNTKNNSSPALNATLSYAIPMQCDSSRTDCPLQVVYIQGRILFSSSTVRGGVYLASSLRASLSAVAASSLRLNSMFAILLANSRFRLDACPASISYLDGSWLADLGC